MGNGTIEGGGPINDTTTRPETFRHGYYENGHLHRYWTFSTTSGRERREIGLSFSRFQYKCYLPFVRVVQSSGYCSEPPTVPNARHNAPQEQSSFAPDTELQYQCCKSLSLSLSLYYCILLRIFFLSFSFFFWFKFSIIQFLSSQKRFGLQYSWLRPCPVSAVQPNGQMVRSGRHMRR